jgi:hypothetical protein
MRQSRIKLASETERYHIIFSFSRGVFLFDAAEKKRMRELLWKTAHFCGVEVITYAMKQEIGDRDKLFPPAFVAS